MRCLVMTFLFMALAGASPARSQVMHQSPRVDDTQGLDALVAENTAAAAKIVGYWRDRAPVGAPRRSFPDRFEVSESNARWITREDRQLMGRRLQAIADHVLSQPSLQGADVEAFLDIPELYRRNSTEPMSMLISFRIRADGREENLHVAVGMTGVAPEESRIVGETVGGCPRSQSLVGRTTGSEFYGIRARGQASRSPISQIMLLGGSLSFHDSSFFDMLAPLPGSRVTAAIQTINCTTLLALANTE